MNIDKFFNYFIVVFVYGLMVFTVVNYVSAKDAYAGQNKVEKDYYSAYCHGQIEFRNSDGTRTDCLTDSEAIEFDFANKWYNCISQAMHYALINKKSPICMLILRKNSDLKYIKRANGVINAYSLPVELRFIDENNVLQSMQ